MNVQPQYLYKVQFLYEYTNPDTYRTDSTRTVIAPDAQAALEKFKASLELEWVTPRYGTNHRLLSVLEVTRGERVDFP